VQIITQLVRLLLPGGTSVAVGVDEIVERDMKPPTEEQLREATAKHAAIRRNAIAVPGVEFNFKKDDKQKKPQPTTTKPGDKALRTKTSGKASGKASAGASGKTPAGASKEQPPRGSRDGDTDKPAKKRRRRRRRKK